MATDYGSLLGGIGGLAGGVSSLFGQSQPGPRASVRYAAQGTEQAYQQMTPVQLQLNQAYNPAFLSQGSQNLGQVLFGTPGGTQSFARTWNGKSYDPITVNTPASEGLLSLAGRTYPELQRLYQQGARSGVQGNLGLLNDFLPQAQNFYNASQPEMMGLRTGLANRANQNLALGSQINPQDAYRISQGVRSDWNSRGLGRSLPAGLAEAMQLYGGGEALRAQRTGEAGNILGQLAQTQPDYMRMILGLGGNPVGESLGLVTGQQGFANATANQYAPINPTSYGASIAGGRDQLSQNAYQNQQIGGLAQGGFDVMGGLYGLFNRPGSNG